VTFGELSDDYMKRHARPNKKSWRQDQWLIDSQLLPHWRHVKARDIGTLDVLALVEAIADRGAKVLANRTLALISKIFAFAIPRGFRADHPCRGLSRPTKERGRDRVLSDEDFQRGHHNPKEGGPKGLDLTAGEVEDIVAWVKAGAVWPKVAAAPETSMPR
jgi:site-specific recombinase XerD